MGAPGSTAEEGKKESKGGLWQPGLMATTMGSTGGAGTGRLLRGASAGGGVAAEAKVSQSVS